MHVTRKYSPLLLTAVGRRREEISRGSGAAPGTALPGSLVSVPHTPRGFRVGPIRADYRRLRGRLASLSLARLA